MPQYYLIVENKQAGPFSRQELQSQGLTPGSMVWTEGMTDWMPAAQVPDLAPLFPPEPPKQSVPQTQLPPAYELNIEVDDNAQPEQPRQQSYQQPCQVPCQRPAGYSQHVNWMPWAIVATILGLCNCIGLVLGIIAIVYASKANSAYLAGDTARGNDANSTACTLTVTSLCFGGLGLISIPFYFSSLPFLCLF